MLYVFMRNILKIDTERGAEKGGGRKREDRKLLIAPLPLPHTHTPAATHEGDNGSETREEATLERWARAVGIEHSKWKIGAIPGGPRGALALESISDGEVLSRTRAREREHSLYVRALYVCVLLYVCMINMCALCMCVCVYAYMLSPRYSLLAMF